MANEDRELDLEVEIEEIDETGDSLFQKVAGTMRSTLMVGLGAADWTQEKVVGLWDESWQAIADLEERGEQVSTERREQIGDEVEKRQEQIKELSGKATDSFDKYSEVVLTRANMPTSDDIDGLSKQVNTLSRKVDKVSKEQKATA